ncbi:hypothetical protein [Morganella morganii]|uniref:hypothetical protein n=1 Tax=Morganella morganii TaxID=582 RepID=UPI0021CFE539|nr:hypothetical protein [Morganella morganii]MCU6376632.1 hypothetical protein [Morganella morganii]
MKIVIIFLFVLIVTGCDSHEKIYGHWENIDARCRSLCSFSIEKHDNKYSDSVIIFDKPQPPYAKSKPFIRDKKHENRYLAKGENGDFLFELYKDRLYGADNSIYEKTNPK